MENLTQNYKNLLQFRKRLNSEIVSSFTNTSIDLKQRKKNSETLNKVDMKIQKIEHFINNFANDEILEISKL